MSENNIHPEFSRQLTRDDKQDLLQQKGIAVWLCGLSGSGKSTIANALEKKLHTAGHLVAMLDGDNLRTGLNAGLGFSDEDRAENIRRAAEVARLFTNNGVITLVTLITPQEKFRKQAQEIVGDDCYQCYVKASYETCEARDVKGLYAKQKAGKMENFTGKGSSFEEPVSPDLILDTESLSLEECVEQLYNFVKPKIQLTDNGN